MPRDQRIKAARKIVADAQKTTGPQPIETAPREPERTLLLFCPEQAGASGAVATRALDIDSECRGRVRPDALEADPVRSARRAVSRRRRKARKMHGRATTAADAATKPHMCPMRHALAVCLFFGLWGEFGRPYGSPACTSSNPKLRRSLVVFLAASQARSWRS